MAMPTASPPEAPPGEGADPTALSRLATLLRLAEGAWAFAVFESDEVREGVMERLRRELAELPMVEISLLEKRPDPVAFLERYAVAEEGAAPVIFFTALSGVLSKLAVQLDLQREQLARLPHRLVFWVTETDRRRLAEEAPNFCSRMSGVFRFPGRVAKAGSPALKEEPRPPDVGVDHVSRPFVEVEREADRPRRIERFQQRIRELRSHQRPDYQAIGDSWYDLAGLHEKAARPAWQEAEVAYVEAAWAYARAQLVSAEADALVRAGRSAEWQYLAETAGQHLRKAIALFSLLSGGPGGNLEAVRGEAEARRRLGWALYFEDRLEEAEGSYTRALGGFEEIGDRLGVTNARKSLGDLYLRQSRLKEAEGSYTRALEGFEQTGDRQGVADIRQSLGNLYMFQGRLEEAEASHSFALEGFEQIGNRMGVADARRGLGDLYLHQDRLEEAEASYTRALDGYEHIGLRLGVANTLHSLGNLYLRQERLEEAEASYTRALDSLQQIGDRLGVANTRQSLGNLYLRQERLEEAEASYTRALGGFDQIGNRLGVANARKSLGDLYLRQDRLEEAEAAYTRAVEGFEQIGDRRGVAKARQGLELLDQD